MDELIKHKSAFNEIPDIGVIWVMDEAIKLGSSNGNRDWTNLGQGEPETGEIKGAPPRIKEFAVEPEDNVYGPLNGMIALRKAIAGHYNRIYRKDKASKYTSDNVSIAMGGRLALTRIFSIVGSVRLGYKVPEYPAYQDMLNYQQDRITSVLVPSKK
jgi:aspartate/methionine/tyrosine aminotransferase